MKPIITLVFTFILMSSAQAKELSFSQAKKYLKEIYKSAPLSFYCGCNIEWLDNKKLVPNHDSCAYQYRKQPKRASRIEFEHIVPAWEFGHQLQCWQSGGRKACKKDKKFKEMEGDLHNLVPAIGEINGDRSNYKYAIIPGEKRVYGLCDAEVDFKNKLFEPAPAIRGDIARTYFYFEHKYRLKISDKQKKLLEAWNKNDPVSHEECAISDLKSAVQGNQNNFVKNYCNTLL